MRAKWKARKPPRPPSEMDKTALSASSLSGWGGLIIGPLCCVRILRLRTFPDCVRRANSRGLYAENAGTQERTQTATQSAPVGHVTQTQKTCGQITGEGLSKGLAPMNVTVQNSRTLMVQLNLRCKEESAELVVWFVSRHFPR